MHKKLFTYIFIFIQFGWASLLMAQSDSVSDSTSTTNETATFRNFDSDKIEDYQNSDDFAYVNYKPPAIPFIEWIKRKFGELMEWLFGSSSAKEYSSSFFDVLKWIIIAAGVLFVLANIMGMEFTQLFRRKHDIKENIFNEALAENINELNFDTLIAQHLQQQNYRYVVRLHYLKALKQLSDGELIDWQPFKTNQEYFNEIKDVHTKQSFGQITSLFNHVWYGQFEVQANQLNPYIQNFEQFYKTIQLKTVA